MNSSRKSPTAVVCITLLSLCPLSPARIIYVDDDGPADFNTIQAAIDDANDGDTVLVAPGIYRGDGNRDILVAPGIYRGDGNRDIDFKHNAITVRSEAGPRTCIVDCQGSPREQHRGFYLLSGGDTRFVLEGFSIVNGYMNWGGGIFCNGYSPHIKNCIVMGNRAASGGAGIYLEVSSAIVENCLVCGNYAYSKFMGYGGGVCWEGGAVVFSNCTIVGNRTENINGGGMACTSAYSKTVVLNNCVIAGNTVRGTSGVGTQLIASPSLPRTGYNSLNVDIQNSCIGEDPKAIYVRAWPNRSQPPSASVIRADPLFANLGHWDPNGTPDDSKDDFWVQGDYHLRSQAGRWDPDSQSWVSDQVTSPCIDAGDPNSPVGEEPEPNGGRINMGAYGGTAEASMSPRAGRIIYVDNDGPADFNTIQGAIDDANDGDTVLVASGTYTGDGNRDIDFLGKGITVQSEQGPEACIIDCGGPYPAYVYWPGRRDGSGRRGGDPEPHDYHRAFHFHSHQAPNSLVQGFTVTGGVAMDPAGNLDNGGAFYCTDSRLTIRNCVIISNAANLGGGVYAQDSHIQIDNCVIAENKAHADLPNSGTGGGACVSGGEVCFSGCRITGNVGSGGGGGISCQGSHRLANCTVTGNRANPYGTGGGILFGPGRAQDTCYVLNSIVWGNTAYVTADGFAADDVAVRSGVMLGTMSVKAVHSLIGADSHLVDDDMIGQWLNGDPLFAAPGRWDPNELASAPIDDFWVEGDYHLKSQAGRWDPASQNWVKDDVTSPCIDAGDPNSPVGEELEPNGGRINMGAYGGTAEASMSYTPPAE